MSSKQEQKTNNSEPLNGPIFRLQPEVDIYENEEGFLLLANMPGVDSSQMKVRVEDQTLTLEGTRKGWDQLEDGESPELVSYERKFKLDRAIASESIDAQLKHGVLQLKLPKTPQAKPREIDIKQV